MNKQDGLSLASPAHPPAPPRMLPGFAHINRYWDEQHAMYAAKLLPGEYYVTCEKETIVTVLGSCVSACIRDPVFGVGGMNHFMLPTNQGNGSWEANGVGASTRYGSFAMEQLINDILKHGGVRKNLEVKLVGGGKILAQMTDIGRKNIDFVEEYIRTEALKVIARDLGDIYPRKAYFTPLTGKAFVKKLRSLHNNTIAERENTYLSQLQSKPVQGDVTLF
ncbi:MAG: chemoreceptor glutamine deamidase CheD [Gammaproteobacteria bacterium]|nr:chemoreceptor glutamine deamidase CheD [Gammaproteobacteria bacterium]